MLEIMREIGSDAVHTQSTFARHELGLHLSLLDAWDVPFPLLPACVAFETDFSTFLEILRAVAFPMLEETVVACLVNAAGVLSIRRQLHLERLDIGFHFLHGGCRRVALS
jgi:hypothetical protein